MSPITITFAAAAVLAAAPAAAAPADAGSPEAAITSYLEALSGPIGETRDLQEIYAHYHPDARIQNAHPKEGGGPAGSENAFAWVAKSVAWWEQNGFEERCVSFETVIRGDVAHVMCDYEWSLDSAVMEERGIEGPIPGVASWQLHHDGESWRILSYLFTKRES